jgi:hypothetical protein
VIDGACSRYGRKRKGSYRVGWEDLTERDRFEKVDVDGRIILKWTFKKLDGGTWTGLIWLGTGTGCGLL